MTVKNRSKICLIVSGVIMVIALILTIFGHGINLGIDFEGGLSMEYDLKTAAVKGDLEQILTDMNIGSFTVTYQGANESQAVIRIKDVAQDDIQDIQAQFEEAAKVKYPEAESVGDVNYVGPVAGAALVRNAVVSVLLAAALILVGSYRNILFLGVVFFNTGIAIVQEIRARNTIRKLKLLNAPHARVIRNGKEQDIGPEQAAEGDLLVLHGGDQVIADGIVVSGAGRAMESLLTGENDDIPKAEGDWMYSGSYLTEGKIVCQLVYVGEESYVGRLTKEAKGKKKTESGLIQEMRKLIRWDSMILLPLGLEYNAPVSGERYRAIGKAMEVPYIDTMNDEDAAKATIAAVKKLGADVGIPADLKEIVKDEDVQFLSESAFADACCPGNPRDTSVEEIAALYRSLM